MIPLVFLLFFLASCYSNDPERPEALHMPTLYDWMTFGAFFLLTVIGFAFLRLVILATLKFIIRTCAQVLRKRK